MVILVKVVCTTRYRGGSCYQKRRENVVRVECEVRERKISRSEVIIKGSENTERVKVLVTGVCRVR